MDTNALPAYDLSDNPTGCCPRFDPGPWDNQELEFSDKRFVRARSRSIMHLPINLGSVFTKTFAAIEKAGAQDETGFIVLSRDTSAWSAEHLFAVSRDVPGQDNTTLSGTYLTKVFEGPYKNLPRWCDELEETVAQTGKRAQDVYFFYTTCPKCAKTYGKNYVVGVATIQ